MLDQFDARLKIPACVLGVIANAGTVQCISFLPLATAELAPRNPLAEKVCSQLLSYVDDPEFEFNLPLRKSGTFFQRQVWAALRKIPCGSLRSYGYLARQLSTSARALGQACGANPIVIVTPCHRVVAKTGLGGFSNQTEGFSLDIKRLLLKHENAALQTDTSERLW